MEACIEGDDHLSTSAGMAADVRMVPKPKQESRGNDIGWNGIS
jgi:hypothetical protein